MWNQKAQTLHSILNEINPYKLDCEALASADEYPSLVQKQQAWRRYFTGKIVSR